MINILVNGSKGKMGKAFTEYIENIPDFNLAYSIDKDNLSSINSISKKPDVIIDFSTPIATFNILNYAVENLVPIVIATTGFTKDNENIIQEYSTAIPIFKSSNLSYGINIFSNIAAILTKKLDKVDIEIIEKHHRNKLDSPSGTAVMIADNINKNCQNKYKYIFEKNKVVDKTKDYNEIGFSSIRGGNIVGEHTVMFIKQDEIIEITHKAYSRNIYIEGAIKAIRFIINQKNGLFSMNDLI